MTPIIIRFCLLLPTLAILANVARADLSVEIRPLAPKGPALHDPGGVAIQYGFDTVDHDHILRIGLHVALEGGRPLRGLTPEDLSLSLDGQPMAATKIEVRPAGLSGRPFHLTLLFKSGPTMQDLAGVHPLKTAVALARKVLSALKATDPTTLINVVVAGGNGEQDAQVLCSNQQIDGELLKILDLVQGPTTIGGVEANISAGAVRALRALDPAEGAHTSYRHCMLIFADGHLMDGEMRVIEQARARGVSISAIRVGHGPAEGRQLEALRSLCSPTFGTLIPATPNDSAADWGSVASGLRTAVAPDWLISLTIPATTLPTDGQQHEVALGVRRGTGTEDLLLPFHTALVGGRWVVQRVLIYAIPILVAFTALLLVLLLARSRRIMAT